MMADQTNSLANRTFDGNFDILIQALEASKCGIIVTDNQLTNNPIIFANQAFEVITGYKNQDIIGRNCRFLQGSDREE